MPLPSLLSPFEHSTSDAESAKMHGQLSNPRPRELRSSPPVDRSALVEERSGQSRIQERQKVPEIHFCVDEQFALM